jgi:transcription elongation GreA/GreB family factor
MEDLIKKFRTQFWQKQHEELEATWLELVQSEVTEAQLSELIELTHRQVPRETGATLLSFFADWLSERGRPEQELAVRRRQAELTPDDPALSRAIAEGIKRVYAHVEGLDQMLHKAGLGYGQTLRDALPRLDRYLAFVPGALVYDADRGPGRVKRTDMLLDKVTVDFDMGAELTWDMGAAQRILKVAVPGGYFFLLDKDRSRLLELATSDPGLVVAMFLRDVGRPVSVKQMQDGMSQAVSPDAWESFWSRARRGIARNPHVVCRTSPGRTFQWAEVQQPAEASAESPAGSSAKERAARGRRHELHTEEMGAQTRAQVLESYSRLSAFTDRRQFLEAVVERRPSDWAEVYAALFVSGKDARARAIMEKALAAQRPEAWQALLESLLTGYRQNPESFLWLVDNFERLAVAGPKGIVTRTLDLLDVDQNRTYWNKLRAALTGNEHRLTRAALGQMEQAEAERFMVRVGRIRALHGYVADEICQHVVAKFPALAQVQEENVIYTTQQGLDKARRELRQMTEEEIPKVADEIARARSHGDLSENYEYKAAKEKQGRLLAKVNRLRDEVARARALAAADVELGEVSVGCRVRLEGAAGHAIEYAILGPWDALHDQGIISYLSPFAQILLGRKVGDSAEVDGQPHRIAAIELGLPG